jgi:tetrahydromethanopterin S-methyltransferase subunit G
MRAELGSVTLRLEVVEKRIDKMASVVVQGARQDERMDQIERRLDRIERPSR